MVEKPLAVNMEHASKMLSLAKKHGIHLLTNYETTWYGSNALAYRLSINEKKIGDIRGRCRWKAIGSDPAARICSGRFGHFDRSAPLQSTDLLRNGQESASGFLARVT
jgi:predicted dehydrogenase